MTNFRFVCIDDDYDVFGETQYDLNSECVLKVSDSIGAEQTNGTFAFAEME